MPVVTPSTYRPPFGFKSGHLQSIWPAVFRSAGILTTERERIDTADGDFLDLDWVPALGARRLAVLSHGLEGCSFQTYVQAMAHILRTRGWDVLAWNYRGCSGEPNRFPHSYHSGATGDLDVVLQHIFATREYEKIALVGFSLGGNITLKYLGDLRSETDPRIRAAVAFSVPCDLASSAAQMAKPAQRIYMRRFLKCLRMKMRQKIAAHPERVEDHGLDQIRTFAEFDEKYTAPLNGFAGADDYWARCSSKPVLKNIRVPTLLVNARNDPFLSPECHPAEEAGASEHLYFENPAYGGHIGFMPCGRNKEYWSETRAAEFLAELV